MQSYTGKEFQEAVDSRDEYQREAMLLAMCLCALSGASIGFFAGWFLKDWLL